MYFNFVNLMNLQDKNFVLELSIYFYFYYCLFIVFLGYFYLYTNTYLQKFSLESENPMLKQRSWYKVSKKERLIFFVKRRIKK